MASNAKGSVRGGRFPFSRSSSGGYTLVEALAVMLVIGILAGTFAVFYRDTDSPEKEARRLARWFTNLITISNRTGRSFSLNCPGSTQRDYIEATWQTSSQEKEIYTSAYGCVFRRHDSAQAESTYSPQWSAMFPAVTVKISRKGAEHYVIISQPGRVRANVSPPLS